MKEVDYISEENSRINIVACRSHSKGQESDGKDSTNSEQRGLQKPG